MRKETETEETIDFLSHFYYSSHFNQGGPGQLRPPWLRKCEPTLRICPTKPTQSALFGFCLPVFRQSGPTK